MTVSTTFPLLGQVFNGYEAAYQRIEAKDAFGTARNYAERLLERAKGLPITGLPKLAADCGGYQKFLSLLAELRVAILLATRDIKVELLRDQAFGSARGTRTPDLQVLLPGGIATLVEVTRFAGWSPKVSEELDKAMRCVGLASRVVHVVGADLGGSQSGHQRRTDNDTLCQAVAREFVTAMNIAVGQGATSGTVHIFRSNGSLRHDLDLDVRDDLPSPFDMTEADRDAWLGSFVFSPSTAGTPETGGGVTTAHRIDVDPRESAFLYVLKDKAEDRQGFPAPYASTPYVVAIQNEEFELSPVSVLSRLTGSRAHTGMSPDQNARWRRAHPYPPKISEAMCGEWRSVFQAWDYGEDSPYRLTEYGAYFDHASAWAQNLSGVLVVDRSHAIVQWLPNPFSNPQINDPRLLSIGFPLEKDGVQLDLI